MKRYWDLSQSERAQLTHEDVEKFLAYELMEKGVLRVEPLKLESEPSVELETRRVFLIREGDSGYGTMLNIGFETIEAAEQARNLIRFIIESPWNAPKHTRPAKPMQVTAEDITTETEIVRARVPLDEKRRREAANAEARKAYDEASKKVADATSGIWSDWHECRRVEGEMQRIRDTLAEYLAMTDGNERLARQFLAKVYPECQIEEACGRYVEAPVDASAAEIGSPP